MGMADSRSRETIQEDFQKHKKIIIGMVEELIAVNHLEYHNKNWLSNDVKKRCESITETLGSIKHLLERLTY